MSDDQFGPPTWAPINLVCKACGTQWYDWVPNNCRINVWIAVVELLQCPKCGEGADHIHTGHKPPGFEP